MAPIYCLKCGKHYNSTCNVCIARCTQNYRDSGNLIAIASVTNMAAPFVLKPEPMSPVLTALPTKRKPAGAVEKMLPAPSTLLAINRDSADKIKPVQGAGKTMHIKLPKRVDYNLGPLDKIRSRRVMRCDMGGRFVAHSDQNAVSEEHGALDSPTPDAQDPELQAEAYFFGQSGVVSKSNPMSKKCFNTPALDDPFVSGPHKPVLNLKLPEEALPASDPRCEKDNPFWGRLRDVTIYSEERAVPKSHSNFKFKNPFNARPTLDQEIVPDPPVFTSRPRLTHSLPRGPPPKTACVHYNPAPGHPQDAPSCQAQAHEISKPNLVFKIKPRVHTTNHLPTSATPAAISDTPLVAAPPNFQPKPRSRDDDNWVMVDRERDRDNEWLMVQMDDEEFWEG